jgi:hypothetical protein
MRYVVFTVTVALLAPATARSDECLPRCDELPAMERELFEQEFLQDRFKKYLDGDIIPEPQRRPNTDKGEFVFESMVDAIARDAGEALTRHNASEAGGGRAGAARGAAGTDAACEVYVLHGEKKTPYNDKVFRETHPCWETEFVLAHEAQHVSHCKKGLKIVEQHDLYSASDVVAYGAGIRKLRALIAETATRCGWKGSTRKTKPNPVDRKEQMVVPTPADVKEILDALKNAPAAARRGQR